ncbi:MAG: C40 family peptidase [Gemmatimonadaceae bacterium]|nr:C40 family peptidase [Gemmatimonadaceae bacterium]
MRYHTLYRCAIAFLVAQPTLLHAQINASSISLGDIERAVHIGRMILDATESRRSRSPGTSTGRGRSAEGAASAAGAVLSSRSASRTARRAVATGDEYIGVPYVWGGSTPRGFDCSGFVQYVYREHGVQLPRTSRQMAHAGKGMRAQLASLREGDLMLFRGKTGVIGHVALYVGNNRILHSSSSGRGVRYDDLSSKRGSYYRSHLVAARRVTEDGRSLVQALSLLYRDYPFDHFDPPDGAPRTGK